MSAILELKETPRSCRDCEISHEVFTGHNNLLRCPRGGFLRERDNANNTRHPDCPLKIMEDNLRWINLNKWGAAECPKCSEGFQYMARLRYCPSCGIKLLPPEEA